MTNFFKTSELQEARERAGKLYLEFLRVPLMSAGIYTLAAGSTDPQKPHREDEVYYVIRGRARVQVGTEDLAIAEGSIIFVEANVEHHFHDITEELTVLVFFAPAENPT
jgi:mannose-6-phosphate isomerase-like protein (cupin superfamily)